MQQPMRQSSSTSTDSNDMMSVTCLQHGSSVNIVDFIKDNVGAPMLKALCNDPSLRCSCTCSHNHQADVTQWTPPTPATPYYNTTRRLSLSQPPSAWESYDQPGTVARPYSWASEYAGGQPPNPQLAEMDSNDAVSVPISAELVNGGGNIMHSGLALVHRHSDGAVCRTRVERIIANH